jgi:hypothetical protein
MEYPTLFTGGAEALAPEELHSPEGVTIHEAGHQFWYGLVASNEFEEAWLDEGFDTYMTAKAVDHSLGQEAWGRRFFGTDAVGWPFVARGARLPRGSRARTELRRDGEKDVMARPAWTYRDASSYGLNSYGKPALVLQTLEGLLGEETMVRVLRTYARRYRFAHPTTADFVATVNEVSGQDWQWFFDQTFFSSDLLDYAVEVRNEPAPAGEGWFEDRSGRLVFHGRPAALRDERTNARVTVVRHGEAVLPVEVAVWFADGRRATERWDGRDRWKRFEYPGTRIVRALVDPQRKLALDVDRANDEWIEASGPARRAATRWAARFLLWVQTFLEMQTAVG